MEPPNLFIQIITEHWTSLIVFFFLLFSSAMASGAEVALFSISQTQLNKLKEKQDSPSKLIVKILQEPQKLLATILITNNLINISVVMVFTPVGEMLFTGLNYIVKAILDVGVVTFFILLFGEIIPKIYANRNNISFARFIIHPLWALHFLLSPLSVPMKNSTIFINKKLNNQKNNSNISVEQLSKALELTENEDSDENEHKILEGVVSFGNTETREIMRPRMDICGIEENMSFPQVMKIIIENGYSRVPVYRDNIDSISGIIYAKDLLPYIDETNFNWLKLKRKAIFIPENKKLNDLLSEFQTKKVHLAVVVDEYGGTCGIVTLEDIIEEIVGDISDEYDEDSAIYTKISDKIYIFEGKTNMKDFYRIMEMDQETEDIFEQTRGETETIAGLWLEIAQILPVKGKSVKVSNYTFEVDSVVKKRIKQLKVVLE